MSAEVSLIIFARAPVPGACKTRLIPALGADGAGALQAQFVERALCTAIESACGPVFLSCAGDYNHPFFAKCETIFGVTRMAQYEGDLGARMLHAFEQVKGPALLAGSDTPCITASDLRACANALMDNDAVFLPAEDGGYGLIGLRAARREPFDGMTWSHARVMDDTRTRLKQAAMTWAEIRTVWDVDEPADLARLAALGIRLPEKI